MEEFWKKVNSYCKLSDVSREAWAKLLRKKDYEKDQYFVQEEDTAENVAFVVKGLFSQFHTTADGDTITKRFFYENYFAASVSSMITKSPSLFTIKALEPTSVWEYNFDAFKNLTEAHNDIASFYIRYMELHWIIEKERLEISLRYDTAKIKYHDFLKTHPLLKSRLKQHEIAAYLGITPTQLSRIRGEK